MNISSTKTKLPANRIMKSKREERFQIRESAFTTALRNNAAVRVVYSKILALVFLSLLFTCAKYFFMPEIM